MVAGQACHSVQIDQLAPGEAGSVLPFLDDWLRGDVPWGHADEYPTVFGRHSGAWHHVIRSDRLLAHAAVLRLDVQIRGTRVPVRLVGSVAVHPEERGRGLGQRLMDAIATEFRESADRVCILWSDLEAFYERSGFIRFGQEWGLRLSLPLGSGETRIRPYEPSDLVSLLMMHLRKPVHVTRSYREFESLLAIPRTSTFVLEEDGRPSAYASVGKGLDFTDVIHESGGEDPALLRLLRGLPRHVGRPLTLLLPPWQTSLRRSLTPHAESFWQQHLGLAIVRTPLTPDFYLEGFDSI